VDRVSEALLPLHEAIAPQSRSATVNYVDETTWHRHGVLAWVWVMANPSVALFTVQSSRSKEPFEALVAQWAGILVSDGYGVYQQWIHGRQACLAHLIRRARGLAEGSCAGVVWGSGAGGAATVGALGAGATDGGDRADLVRPAGPPARPISFPSG
jgi:transposase